MYEHEKFVDFHKYCELCKYEKVDESEDPCDECLTYPVNTESLKPVRFEEKT